MKLECLDRMVELIAGQGPARKIRKRRFRQGAEGGTSVVSDALVSSCAVTFPWSESKKTIATDMTPSDGASQSQDTRSSRRTSAPRDRSDSVHALSVSFSAHLLTNKLLELKTRILLEKAVSTPVTTTHSPEGVTEAATTSFYHDVNDDVHGLTRWAVYAPYHRKRIPINYDHLLVTQNAQREAERIASAQSSSPERARVLQPSTLLKFDETICYGRYAHYRNAPREWVTKKLVDDLRGYQNLFYMTAKLRAKLGVHPLILAHPELDLEPTIQSVIATISGRSKSGYPQPTHVVEGNGTIVQRGFLVPSSRKASLDVEPCESKMSEPCCSFDRPRFAQTELDTLNLECASAAEEDSWDHSSKDDDLLARAEKQRKDSAVPRDGDGDLAKPKGPSFRGTALHRTRSDQHHTRSKGSVAGGTSRRYTDPPQDIMIVRQGEAEEAIASDSETDEDDINELTEKDDHGSGVVYQQARQPETKLVGKEAQVSGQACRESTALEMHHRIGACKTQEYKLSTYAVTPPMRIPERPKKTEDCPRVYATQPARSIMKKDSAGTSKTPWHHVMHTPSTGYMAAAMHIRA